MFDAFLYIALILGFSQSIVSRAWMQIQTSSSPDGELREGMTPWTTEDTKPQPPPTMVLETHCESTH